MSRYYTAQEKMPKDRNYLNGLQGQQLRKDKDNGMKMDVILLKYNISSASYYRIIRNNNPELGPSQKKIQQAKYQIINDLVHDIFQRLREKGYPLSGPTIQFLAGNAKRKLLQNPMTTEADRQLYSGATFGNSWLRKFKATHALRKLRINGERASVQDNVWDLMVPLIEEIEFLNLPINQIYNWMRLESSTEHFQNILLPDVVTMEPVQKKIAKE